MISNTVVELEGVNGEWFTLAGPQAGDRGISLGTGVTGLYDPPVKVVYEEPGNYPGARYLNHRILRRDIVFGVWILNDRHSGGSWMSRDSEWRKAWAFDRDCKLHITTEDSGHRYLHLRLGESIDVSLETDPNGEVMTAAKMVCISGDVFWYEDDVVYEAVTTEDTTFNPNPLPWPWPQESIPYETLTITVDPADGRGGLNPTDQPIFPKWSVPGSELRPAEPYIPGIPWLGAPKSPATLWTIPDYSFEDPLKGNRRIRMPGLIGGLRTDEVQAVFIKGKPTGGTWQLTYDGETTVPIPYNASNGTVKAALEALGGLAFNDVSVTRAAPTNEVQTISMKGGATAGTFTLTADGQTTAPLPFNANAGQIRQALVNLSNIGFFDVSVTGSTSNDVQKVTLIGEPTKGRFTLSIYGETTEPINWDASPWEVQNKLAALDAFNGGFLWIPGDIAVSKPPGSYQPWTITFQTYFNGVDVPQLVATQIDLEGGIGIDILVETEQEGTRNFAVTFNGNLSGVDFPMLTANASGLTGDESVPGPFTVEIKTAVDGSRPYLITFTNNKSGEDVPLLGVVTSSLTGSVDPVTSLVQELRKGVTAPAENCVVDSDPRVEQVTSESGSQIWARMNGVRWRHFIPPYTRAKTFEITASGCLPGQMVQLRLPRPWSRPWGLE